MNFTAGSSNYRTSIHSPFNIGTFLLLVQLCEIRFFDFSIISSKKKRCSLKTTTQKIKTENGKLSTKKRTVLN